MDGIDVFVLGERHCDGQAGGHDVGEGVFE